MRKRVLSVLFMALIAIALTIPIHQAVADEARGLKAGDLLKMKSVRGVAHDPSTNKTTKATLTLTLSVRSMNNTRVEFTVVSGQISIGDRISQSDQARDTRSLGGSVG